jgi:hypothetical protein
MSKPKIPAAPPPPQPEAQGAKGIFGADDTPNQAVKRKATNTNALRATFLQDPVAPGVGVQL